MFQGAKREDWPLEDSKEKSTGRVREIRDEIRDRVCRVDRERRVVMMKQSDLPIVCTLTPEALEARRLGLLTELANRAEDCEQITDGIRMRFSATSETLPTITRAVEEERHCCRFL